MPRNRLLTEDASGRGLIRFLQNRAVSFEKSLPPARTPSPAGDHRARAATAAGLPAAGREEDLKAASEEARGGDIVTRPDEKPEEADIFALLASIFAFLSSFYVASRRSQSGIEAVSKHSGFAEADDLANLQNKSA